MRQFLEDTITRQPLTEGKLADNPLRQAKNLFIGNVSMIGKEGAIPGGMDIEQTYQLIDTYIQECERIQSLDAIKKLQFNMIIDFTSRVAQAKCLQVFQTRYLPVCNISAFISANLFPSKM